MNQAAYRPLWKRKDNYSETGQLPFMNGILPLAQLYFPSQRFRDQQGCLLGQV